MKKLLILFFLLVFTSLVFSLNISSTQAAKAKPVVTADSQYFDASRGLYFLKGNVYVATSSRIITADQATADPISLQVWAEGNVTLKQDDIVFTGDKLLVLTTKTLAQVTGNLYFVRNGIAISSDYGEYNWKTKIATFSQNVIVKDASGQERNYQSLTYQVINNEVIEAH